MKADDYVLPSARNFYQLGLTVRDHIAIEAMNGMGSLDLEDDGYYNTVKGIQALVSRAYKIADAMILESNK